MGLPLQRSHARASKAALAISSLIRAVARSRVRSCSAQAQLLPPKPPCINLTTGAVLSLSGSDLVIGEGGTSASGSATLNMSGSIVNTSAANRSIDISGRGAAGNSAGNGALNVTAGAITLTGAGSINLADGSITTATITSQFNVSGGSVATGATGGIRFGLASSSYGSGSVAAFNLTGGSVYVGIGGLVSSTGVTNLTDNINLGGGTLGALGNWTTTPPHHAHRNQRIRHNFRRRQCHDSSRPHDHPGRSHRR